MRTRPDWSFVIKLHALFALERPQLRNYVEQMSVGGQFGKLVLAETLDAIDAKHARFIRALSSIRNHCIHDVRNVSFKFDGYIDGLSEGPRHKLLSAFADLLVDSIELTPGKKISRDEYVRKNTRAALWIAATLILAELYVKKDLAQMLKKGSFLEIFGGSGGMLDPTNLSAKQP